MRGIHDFLGQFVLDAKQADVVASLNNMTAIGHAEVYFSIDGEVGRQHDLQCVGYGLDRGREHADQAAANCCSGLVPAPEVPGTERLTSRRRRRSAIVSSFRITSSHY